MVNIKASARQEWADHWYLPLAAAVCYSAAGLHIYGLGAFLEPLRQEFGWLRSQVFSGAAVVSIGVALGSVPMGALIDRVGPRRVGMIGILSVCGALAMLSTATGTFANWIMLWTIVALSATMVQAPVWTTAIVGRFDAARGLALGITLCGSSIPIFALPLLATWLVENVGWRPAFVLLSALWAIILFPVLFFLFRGRRDIVAQGDHASEAALRKSLPGLSLSQALRTVTLYKLMFAAGFFALAILGIVVHFVPMLTDVGTAPMTAAAAASFIGIFSIVGRLTTGAFLDRLPGNLIGAASFILPVLGCVVLFIESAGLARYFISAMLFGLALGAETDVVPYLASRHFGLRNFGSIQGALLCAIALGSASGPLAAGLTFDHYGSYTPFLLCTSALMIVSAILVGSLRKVPDLHDAQS